MYIIYVNYTLPLALAVHDICKQYAAARACSARNLPTFLGRLCYFKCFGVEIIMIFCKVRLKISVHFDVVLFICCKIINL